MIITSHELKKLKMFPRYKNKDKIKYNFKTGNFRKGTSTFIYAGICKKEGCNNHHITLKRKPGNFCCHLCAMSGKNNPSSVNGPWNKGKTSIYSKETLKKMSKAKRGVLNTNFGRLSGKHNPNYKHGLTNTAVYKKAEKAKRRFMKINQTPLNVDMKEIRRIYKICLDMNKRAGGPLFHVDHIIPLSKGGLHHEDNLQVLYWKDNLKKYTKIEV